MDLEITVAEVFSLGSPFPHLVIDELLDPVSVRFINAEWSQAEPWRLCHHKHSLKRACQHSRSFGVKTRETVTELNSPEFVETLAMLTGIEGLVADETLAGGGLHETFPGGFLDVHADFNIHPTTRLHRRLNLLVYLNEDWRAEWGGDLELWDREKEGCEKRIAPVAGRAVIFSTTDFSYHGHPTPLTCPPDRSRRSIALYYYSADRPAHELSKEHSTLYLGEPVE